MEIEWHPRAQNDTFEIADYINIDSPTSALAISDEIQRQVSMLIDHPRLGRLGRIPGTRELVIAHTSYIAIYRIIGERIRILRIFHGARKWPRRL
ncbi:type II toxin-antitoxin system RelE/ParE family toxin [Labrys miyagiensis]|uniref:type II toxin-antitoxin system RelE/ParE family toxin n=1 Tax=Labrys miyagiensis TaxID=346912 RepID=UPI0024E17148|nr:type II toxin-antitoxin system RelE/ParE family toxin [Labrys miyagiensis]